MTDLYLWILFHLSKLKFNYIKKSHEEFKATKVVIRIHILKKNRQHNGQKKKYKWKNNDLQNINIIYFNTVNIKIHLLYENKHNLDANIL